jgi:hypothetical protein
MPSPRNTAPAGSRSFFTSSTNDRSAMVQGFARLTRATASINMVES